jgi:hypothetical protein
MIRQEYNKLILAKLSELIHKYPDQRFGQLLVNSEVIKLISSDKQLLAEDPFYEEPNVTLKRMENSRLLLN